MNYRMNSRFEWLCVLPTAGRWEQCNVVFRIISAILYDIDSVYVCINVGGNNQ